MKFRVSEHRVIWLCGTELGCASSCQTCFLCTLHVRNVITISLDNLVRKNNTLHHYPTPYPRSTAYRLAPIWLQALTAKYSNCISYNFFIFCPICMKFSHNILHTYSFILSILKHNWKIRRFWVVDPLHLLWCESFTYIHEQRQTSSFASLNVDSCTKWINYIETNKKFILNT